MLRVVLTHTEVDTVTCSRFRFLGREIKTSCVCVWSQEWRPGCVDLRLRDRSVMQAQPMLPLHGGSENFFSEPVNGLLHLCVHRQVN